MKSIQFESIIWEIS